MSYFLKPLSKSELEIVLEWRNSDRIRCNMYDDQIIPFEKHLKWYEKIKNLKTEEYFVLFLENKPLGLISLKNITFIHNRADWGFYIGDLDAPRGSGLLMGFLALEYAFNNLSLHKVNGEVLEFNTPSVKYHEKLGFKRDGILRNEFKKNNIYYDIYKYSILKSEWDIQKNKVIKNIKNKGIDM